MESRQCRSAGNCLDPFSDNPTVVDTVTLPVVRENSDRQCIAHEQPVGVVTWHTETEEPASKDYCLYYFTSDPSCHGKVDSFFNISSTAKGELGCPT